MKFLVSERQVMITRFLLNRFKRETNGGELINPLLDYLPAGSTIILFGNLSQQKIEFLPTQLLRESKKMNGFFLGHWIEEKGMLKAALNLVRVNRLLKNGMESKVQAVFALDDIQKAVELYEGNMGGGKVLVGPHPLNV